MNKLTDLNLSNNAFVGSIPRDWGRWKTLGDLDVSFNALTGALPKEFGNLKNLGGLNLSNNGISGELPNLVNMTNLHTLDLSNNDVSGLLPPELSLLPSLQTLNISSNAITGGLEHLLRCVKLKTLDASGNRLAGSLSFMNDVGDQLMYLVLSRNKFDLTISPSDFALSSENRTMPIIIDLRENEFSCPFPTAEAIREASKGSVSHTIVLSGPCMSNYGSFLLNYCLPFLVAVVVAFMSWKIGIHFKLTLAAKLSQPLKKDTDDEITLSSHKRLKFFRLGIFAFIMYDIINDISVYESILAVVDNDVFQNPCSTPNQRGSFYPKHVAHLFAWELIFTSGKKIRYPDVEVYDNLWFFIETGFADFTQYSYYTSETVIAKIVNGAVKVSGSERSDNIQMFASFCENFYKVDSIRECAYSNATTTTSIPKVNLGASCVSDGPDEDRCLVEGLEGCVRVRNVQLEKNRRFKKFVVASIVVVCVKELFKMLLILSIWLRAPSRKLHPIEVGLIGESPFCLLLVWRRPNFVQELLLTNSTRISLLIVFFVEEVLESANQIFLVVYFALHVDQQGIEYGVMFSLASSAAKMMKTGYNLLMAWKRAISAKVHTAGLQRLHVNHHSWNAPVLPVSGRRPGRRQRDDVKKQQVVVEGAGE